jgi:hypothetical protein
MKNMNIKIDINRQLVLTYAAVIGGIFLLFYWTHLGFASAIKSTKSSISTVEERIQKASALAAAAKRSGNKQSGINTGLLSFLQTSAEKTGLEGRIASIRPKTVPGASEAATIRVENLNYNEMIGFLRSVERYGNLTSSNVKINKRFDDAAMLNLTMDVVKR